MSVIDRDIHLARALLVESNVLMRSVAAAQLRDVGVGHVSQTSRIKDARLLIEREPFDIVVCNREFEGLDDNGQDLLDELRRENLLPHATVFLMVTSQAKYHHVVEAAEASMDGILVRPYTSGLLADRLREARQRKRELADVLQALDSGHNEVALARALKRFQEQLPYATYCGRLVAELLLRMNKPDDAGKMFEKLALPHRAGWARLGQARCRLASGDMAAARKVVIEVLKDEPDNADAHDLMGRIMVELSDFDAALGAYRRASALTPGCLLRAQHSGALAFYQGETEPALKVLERSVGLGVQSRLFDALTLTLIAMLRFDAADAPGVSSMRAQLARYRERHPRAQRLKRMDLAVSVLVSLLGNAQQSALVELRELSNQVGENAFDLEAANLLLSLWARVPAALADVGEHEAVVEHIGMRFCSSKAIGEVLAASARRNEPALGILQGCQARITAVAEEAIELSLRGDPAAAVQMLMQAGEQSLNVKLLEMTCALARRHASALPDGAKLAARAAELMNRCCLPVSHIAGIQRTGRAPGGLQLRLRSAAPKADEAVG